MISDTREATDAAPLVSIVVPTLNRRVPLGRALRSLAAQDAEGGIEILVIDNSPDGNAARPVARMAAGARIPIRYLSMPEPGVASARNAGVAAARGRWIAFLDDDEAAAPGWVSALLRTAAASGADAVFGPVRARAEDGRELGAMERYFSRRLNRPDGADITDLAAYLGTNNSMFSRAASRSVPGPFAVSLDSVGGEDSLFLRQLVLAERRFAWSTGAEILEWVPSRRLDWRYIRRRKFLSGQIRTFVHTMGNPPSWARTLLWMGIGATQAALAGCAALLAMPFRTAVSRRFESTAWGGLGKVFWMRRFRPMLYGRGLVS